MFGLMCVMLGWLFGVGVVVLVCGGVMMVMVIRFFCSLGVVDVVMFFWICGGRGIF